MRRGFIMFALFCKLLTLSAISINPIGISRVKMQPSTSKYIYINQGDERYDIEIDLINKNEIPVVFWSMSCGWSLNFMFNKDDVFFYEQCFSNVFQRVIIFPFMKTRYKGIIYCKHKLNEILTKDLSIAFLYFDSNRFSKREYQRIILGGNKKHCDFHSPICCSPDTVWYKISTYKNFDSSSIFQIY